MLAALNLFGNAGTDEDSDSIGILLLDELSAGNHRGWGVRDFVCGLRNLRLNQAHEGRAAGAGHKVLLSRHLLQIFLCFLDARDVCTHADLDNIGKAGLGKRFMNLRHRHLQAELADDRGSDERDNLLALLNLADDADNVAALINSAEGAGVAAGAAGDAFFVVNNSLAVFADADSTDGAGAHAGTVDFQNSAIRAHLLAAAAFNALRFVDEGAVLNNGDGLLGAVVHALVRDAVTAHIRDVIGIDRALVAGCRQHINDGQIGALRLVERELGGLDDVAGAFLTEGHVNAVL